MYNQMANAKIIVCQRSMLGDYASCKPGPSGKELKLNRNGTLRLSIGRKVPSVAGISRLDQTSALAQISLGFESSGGYQFFKKYEGAFSEDYLFGVYAKPDTDNEQHTVHLRLYDDGWRIERIE